MFYGLLWLIKFNPVKSCTVKITSRFSTGSMGLNEFLVKTKIQVATSPTSVNIVLGNESCDLDSAVSALLYAYFSNSFLHPGKCTIPVLNIPEAHLNIKTEVVYFLRKNSVPLSSLVFRDSVNLKRLASENILSSVVLVDHHVLAAQDQFLSPFVNEVIDHRPILEPWSHLKDKTMDIVGSCITHVAKKMLNSAPELIRDDFNVANLIYGTILLDTACLSPQANRATPADHHVINQLKTMHPNLQAEKELFEALQAAKSDVSNLSSADLLVKDLKFSKHGLPIAGLPILVQDFLSRSSDVEETLLKFLQENNSTLLILMGQQIRNGQISRELALYSTNLESEERACKILNLMKSCTNPSLGLEEVGGPALKCGQGGSELKVMKVYRVGNAQVSRKQVVPLVEKALDE